MHRTQCVGRLMTLFVAAMVVPGCGPVLIGAAVAGGGGDSGGPTPPAATVGLEPDAEFVAQDSVVVTFGADRAATFELALDGAAVALSAAEQSAGRKTLTGLAEGPHTARVIAIDGEGLRSTTPAQRTWIVDVTPPSAPTATVRALADKSLALSWAASTDAGSGIEDYVVLYDAVSRDPAAGVPYGGTGATEGNSGFSVGNTTSATLSGLGGCRQIFVQVRARDRAGNESTLSLAREVTRRTACGGSGLFERGTGSATLAGVASDVVVHDFDADAIPDLAVALQGSAQIVIMLGRGTGGRATGVFDALPAIPTLEPAVDLELGDFDGNGIADLAVVEARRVEVLLGRADGQGHANATFQRLTISAPADFASCTVSDFDGDRFQDIAVSVPTDNRVHVYLGRGDGRFQSAPLQSAAGVQPRRLVHGDFDGDQIEDLAVTCSGDEPGVCVLLGLGASGRGNGAFAAEPVVSTAAAPSDLAVGHFDGDRVRDLAVSVGNDVVILQGQGSRFGDGTFVSTGTQPAGTNVAAIAIGDWNHDALLDIATANAGSADVGVLLAEGTDGVGSGTLRDAPHTTLGGAGAVTPSVIASADLDSDGILDLVVGGSFPNAALQILFGRGATMLANGGFNAAGRTTQAAGTQPWHLASADFDVDGIPDVAMVDRDGSRVLVMLGTGADGQSDGGFAAPIELAAEGKPVWAHAADLDDDGFPDLVVARQKSVIFGSSVVGRVSVFMNRGDRAVPFTASATQELQIPQTTSGGTELRQEPRGVTSGDFNGDGILDLAVANLGPGGNSPDGSVSVMFGIGNDGRATGTFERRASSDLTVGRRPFGIATADLNTDGILDLVVTNANSTADVVWVLLGNGSGGRGDGTFVVPASPISIGTSTVVGASWSIQIADFNADRIPDLVLQCDGNRRDPNFPNSRETGGLLVLLPGNGTDGHGDGTFGTPVEILRDPTRHITVTSVADFDGDGIRDLIAGVFDASELLVLRGLGSDGRGNGNFTLPVSIPLSAGTLQALAGDFDSDGLVDLLAPRANVTGFDIVRGTGVRRVR